MDSYFRLTYLIRSIISRKINEFIHLNIRDVVPSKSIWKSIVIVLFSSCQVLKNFKTREKLGNCMGGCVKSLRPDKKMDRGWVDVVWPILFFLGFLTFFNLTRPLRIHTVDFNI